MAPTTRPGPAALAPPASRLRTLSLLLAVAVAVSVAHYVDSVVNFAAYPKSTVLPNPSELVIATSWFAFTAAGAAGWWRYRQRADALALLLIALYSGSGLIGLLHYSVAGALNMPWWRHLHVVADIALGFAIFAFALSEARRRR